MPLINQYTAHKYYYENQQQKPISNRSRRLDVDDLPVWNLCCEEVRRLFVMRYEVMWSCIIRFIGLDTILVIAIGRKWLQSEREDFLWTGVIKDIFYETGTKLRENKNSETNEKGTARLSPRVLKVCEEKLSGVVFRELFNFLIWPKTADTGNRIFDRWLVGMAGLWIHGSLALSMAKAVENYY